MLRKILRGSVHLSVLLVGNSIFYSGMRRGSVGEPDGGDGHVAGYEPDSYWEHLVDATPVGAGLVPDVCPAFTGVYTLDHVAASELGFVLLVDQAYSSTVPVSSRTSTCRPLMGDDATAVRVGPDNSHFLLFVDVHASLLDHLNPPVGFHQRVSVPVSLAEESVHHCFPVEFGQDCRVFTFGVVHTTVCYHLSRLGANIPSGLC